jgi:hypothetical protein
MANNLVNELVVSPLGDLIAAIGKGVGEAQAALDYGSLKTTLDLYNKNLQDDSKEMGDLRKLLRDIGYRPTFYVLPETTVNAKITLNLSSEEAVSTSNKQITPTLKSSVLKKMAYATPINASTLNKYNMDYNSVTELSFKIVPVPAPLFLDNLIETGKIDDFINPPPVKPKSNVIFSSYITEDRKSIVNNRTIEILGEAGYTSNNPITEISSTIRSYFEQATTMYDNEKAGNHISYAATGKEVIAVFNANKDKPKDEVISLMAKLIEELAKENRLTSHHCVPEDKYKKNNVIDIRKNLKNPRDLSIALSGYDEVTKIITPYTALSGTPYKSSKISVDANEPAIHVEFKLN